MRKLVRPATINNLRDVQDAFNEVFRASQENDTIDIAQPYTITGSFTPTRTLNVTSPTIANVAAVLATLIQDLKRGGTSKTT
jgi:hypothetical protein